MVAREGSIAQASKQLPLGQPTIIGQIRALENAIGEKPLTRSGRSLVPDGGGAYGLRYANEIFAASDAGARAKKEFAGSIDAGGKATTASSIPKTGNTAITFST